MQFEENTILIWRLKHAKKDGTRKDLLGNRAVKSEVMSNQTELRNPVSQELPFLMQGHQAYGNTLLVRVILKST
jgi:hypothetical protein